VDRIKSVKGEGSVTIRDHYFESIEEDHKFLTDWLGEAYRILKDNSAIYVFAHWSKWNELLVATEGAGFQVKNMIVLNKSNHGMGDLKGSYAPKHELLMFATKGRHILRFPKGRIDDIWNVPVKFSGAKRFHPNEKPLSWICPAVENSSGEGDIILDPFMGSGTTGVASIEMGRRFVGIEKDKEYYDIAGERVKSALEKQDGEIF
jgi:site-specific DNA-methyltransferase (adenine-specific)